MKQFILIIILLCFSFSSRLMAEEYAILISAGKATTDDTFSNSEYWYDLFLAYEDLVLNEGYSHDNIFVFYGDGSDYYSNRPRYRTSLHGWGQITDFNNSYSTMNTQIGNIANQITANDNVHIRWVVGHGSSSSNADTYSVLIQNQNQHISETQLYAMLNQISNYARRKIVWMTCRSGCIVHGSQHLKNNKTVVIASSNWNQNSYAMNLSGETLHAQLNYTATSALYGENPLGANYDADDNNDNEISFLELFNDSYNSSIVTSTPQLGDVCPRASRTFLDEQIELQGATINNTEKYETDQIRASNYTVNSSGNVTFAARQSIRLQSGFHATNGSYFRAYKGNIACRFIPVKEEPILKSGTLDNSTSVPDFEIQSINFNGGEFKDSDIEVFPNPTPGNITVSLKTKNREYQLIEVFNKTGTLVYKTHFTKNSIDVDLSAFPDGVYYVKVISDGLSSTKKVVKY